MALGGGQGLLVFRHWASADLPKEQQIGAAIREQRNSCPYRADFRFVRVLVVDLLAVDAGLAILGARFCHANESALSTLAPSASPRQTFVLPRKPHAPFTGLKMLGWVVTNAVC
jgi:hypothetical protein